MAYPTMTFGGKPFYMSNDAIPGQGDTKGTGGALYTYRVGIQAGSALSLRAVTLFIDSVLGHARLGWTRNGRVRFRRVGSVTPGTFILVSFPDTVDKLCYPLDTAGEVSCRNGNKVVLNLDRWKKGVPHYVVAGGPGLTAYRTMLVNHEMGHRIGQHHRSCPGAGKAAYVMQQQTYGMQGCRPSWWPLTREVNSLPTVSTATSASLMSWPAGPGEPDAELE